MRADQKTSSGTIPPAAGATRRQRAAKADPAKFRVDLQAEMTALEAARLILLRLLEMLERNEPGARADEDPEFLHDFRVAVRRTRSALGQLDETLPPPVNERFRPSFAWLGAATTPVRDLDVYLHALPGYRDALPQSLRAGLDPLERFLRERRLVEQRKLVRALASRRCRQIVGEWRSCLEQGCRQEGDAPAGGLPVRAVADKRLQIVFRKALKEGSAIGADSPPAPLHELRKRCKKLRYLLEFFQSLYPPRRVRGFIEGLKVLQDNLGSFHDLQVQIESLRAFARRMKRAGEGSARSHQAMERLVQQLTQRQERVRGEFAARFAAFASRRSQHRFEALFAEGPHWGLPPR